MKFKQFLLFTLCISIFACSSDSSPPPDDEEGTNDDSTLLKKIIYNKGTDDEYSETFSYDGNKLIEYDEGDGRKNLYFYENGLLIKDVQYFNNEIAVNVELEYDSEGKLTTFTESWLEPSGINGRVYNHILTHNGDNTITKETYRKDTGTESSLIYTETITYIGNDISKFKEGDFSIIYTYDDKNGMFKNIHAIEVLNILAEIEFGAFIWGNTNNYISYSEVDPTDNVDSREFIEYTYNENGYPKTAISTYEANGIIDEDETDTIEYFYE